MRAALAALVACTIATAGCGHVIRSEFAPNHGGPVDFRKPRCGEEVPPPAAGDPGERVLVRYLGAGGLHIEWAGHALLVGPFFSNPGRLRVMLGRLRQDPAAVEKGLAGLDAGRVRGILVGHSHYDHLGDVPIVAECHAPGATIYVNGSGANMLAAYPSIRARTVNLDLHAGSWIRLRDGSGRPLPLRFLPVTSGHAAQIFRYHWADGEVVSPWSAPWSKRRISRFRGGTTFAFVLDLMAPEPEDVEERPHGGGAGPAPPGASEKVRYRIYYQDAANPAGVGVPPAFAGADDRPVDLAVLCMASSHLVEDHPGAIVRALRPRHVLITHYEDFMRDRDKPLRFVPFLTNRRANAFFVRLREALDGTGRPPRGPEGSVCGPSSPAWTMPIPGEWATFRPVERSRAM